ncbi:nucleotidyltransferase domain-containing protein [Candidatus Peregrinibacteria bacterium]|nr:nucleotidyltransferase domain-containing protein [Candidatus Peregrinibacteria bacterium]
MNLEHYSLDKLGKEIAAIIRNHLDVSKYRVFFFGSRVTGKNTERSDIDIGIEGPIPVDVETMMEIEEEIDKLPTLYKIEIVDFVKVEPKFKQVAKQHIEYLKTDK